MPRLALAAGLLGTLAVLAMAQSPKHVVFIVIDDLGFDDVNFRSHQIQTPNINKLASEGLILTNYYLQDVCSPSRSSIQSGRYAMHHGVVDWIPPKSPYGLMLNDTTMADKMLSAGYETHAIGKWHMGLYKWAYTPTFRGFNSFLGFYSGGEDYFTHMTSGAFDMHRDPSPHCGPNCSTPAWDLQGTYSTTAFSDEAVRIVGNHDVTKPLFLYLAYQAVHAPAQVPEQYKEPYKDTISDPERLIFAGMLACLDEGIGNVTAALASKGMLDDSLIVFTTDNGGPVVGGDAVGARNYPYRGGKHSVYEGGVRGTAFIRPPAWAPFARTNTTYDNLMHAADWLPTMCDVIGVTCNTTNPIDGVSHWKQIQSASPTPVRDNVVIGNSTNMCPSDHDCGFAYRSGDWKILRGSGGEPWTWTVPCSSTGGKCNVAYGVCCPENDLSKVPAESLDECCGLCRNTSGCKGFTYQIGEKTCFMKTKLVCNNTVDNACVSGALDSTGVPHPNTINHGTELFNVVTDPRELSDQSSNQANILSNLQSELDGVLETFFQAENDPECPFSGWRKTPKGPVLEPWC